MQQSTLILKDLRNTITLRSNLEKLVAPFYATNDEAHSIQHAIAVVTNLLRFNHMSTETISGDALNAAIAAAYVHDVCRDNKEFHHTLGADWVFEYADEIVACGVESCYIPMIAKAVEQHRSSFKGVRNNSFCELVAAADTGKPISEVGGHLHRCMLFRAPRTNDEIKHARMDSIAHLKKKYGTGGYNTITPFYKSLFGDLVDKSYQIVDALPDGPFTDAEWRQLLNA